MTDEQNNETAQNLPKNQARRKTIKKLVIGAGALAGYSMLPEQWTKPIIEQIILPAHAQTSGLTLIDPLTLTLLSGTQTSATVSVRVAGAVSPATQNLAVLLLVQGALWGTTATLPASEKNVFQETLANVGDLLVKEAVAAETCSQLSQQVTSDQDGSFSADFELSCGPGITSITAIASLVTSSGITAKGTLLLSADGTVSSVGGVTEPSISGNAFINNSSGTVTVEWKNPSRTDTVGPGEGVEAPDGTDASTNIWVTGTNYTFACPGISACLSGENGGAMKEAINNCGGQVVIEDCSTTSSLTLAVRKTAVGTKNYAW